MPHVVTPKPLWDFKLTPEEVAAELRVPLATLQTWRSRKSVTLPYLKVGRHVRYRRADLDAFLERGLRNQL